MGEDDETPWPEGPTDGNPFDEPPPPLDEGALAPVSDEEKSKRDKYVDYLRGHLLTSAQLDDIAEPVAIVGEDFLYADTLNWLVGKPGHGKSFVAIDLAGCVATGIDWHSRPTLQGPVLYIAAEGVRGVKQRVRAWEQEHRTQMDGVDFLPFPVQSTNGSHWDALVALTESRQYALVVVDTQARVTVGVEENSNKEMGTFVHQAERLRTAASSCVVLVHHVGSGSERGRGATTLDGALSTIMKADRDGTIVTLSCQKNKDAAEWDPIEFNLMSLGASAVLRTAQQVPAALVRAVSPDAMRTAKRWFDVYDAQWQAPGALQEATEVTRPTFARHRAELERFGYAERMNLGKSQYRYRLTGDPSVPPDQRPPAPAGPVVEDPPESPPPTVLEGLD